MSRYRIGFLFGCLLSTQVHAVTCYLTMVKANCWKDYDLSVEVSNAESGVIKGTIKVPEGKLWVRQSFECEPGNTLALVAKFSPVFWAGDENKTFPGQRYWNLPDKIKPGETGWNVTVCYPKYFANVPIPPDATANCACDLTHIPPLESQKNP
ncbi:MAG: hypothetical protein CK424_02440 [Legionella sp.]|nr:MAG: hypothetical protein CK424_02440 [Legionella sp.]